MWLVIVNQHYYPDEGSNDWVLVTPDRDEAAVRYDTEAKAAKRRSRSVYLIRIHTNGEFHTVHVAP